MRAPRATSILVAALLVAAAAGCGSGGGSGKTVTETKTVTGAGATSTAEAGTEAQAASVNSAKPSGLRPAIADLFEFLSPSKNIGCTLEKNGARCDIRQYTWKNPPKPASCEFDWGGNLHVFGKRPGEIGCVSDSAMGGKDILPYSTYVQNKTLRCTSETSGMTCKNLVNGHGFFVSKERYRVF